jgi:hypothetical protein
LILLAEEKKKRKNWKRERESRQDDFSRSRSSRLHPIFLTLQEQQRDLSITFKNNYSIFKMAALPDFSNDSGLAALDKYLADKSYIDG